jgi:hypothetical protein
MSDVVRALVGHEQSEGGTDQVTDVLKRTWANGAYERVPRQYSDCGETRTRSTPRSNEDGSSADRVDHDGEPLPAVSCLTSSFVAEIRRTSTNLLRAYTWVGRTVRASAGPGRCWFGC